MGYCLLVLAMLSGCLRSSSFQCESDQSCTHNGQPGRCEATHYCSVADSSCPGGNRYGDSAGSLSGQCVGDQQGSDAGIDVPADDCFGTGFEKVCLVNPMPTLDLNAAINTDTDSRCIAAYPTVCAIGAIDVSVSGIVTASGSKPLVVVASHGLTVTGTLDASSTTAGASGAASNNAACTTANGTNATNAGGGAGGTFGGRGGNGGTGDQDNNDNAGGTWSTR